MRGIGDFDPADTIGHALSSDFTSNKAIDPLQELLDDLSGPFERAVAASGPKRKEPRGPALVRLECADGTLIEGRALEYRVEHPLSGSRDDHEPARIVVTFLAETTTPEWKRHHIEGSDMGEPINPDDPELHEEPPAPAPPSNPKWGEFA